MKIFIGKEKKNKKVFGIRKLFYYFGLKKSYTSVYIKYMTDTFCNQINDDRNFI